MTKLISLLGRKSVPVVAKPAKPAAAAASAPNPPPVAAPAGIELDQDLFSPLATQLGQENEAVRNLLIDAEHKIDELEIIKRSIGKLVDPVSRTLRAYEETKTEKLSLQNILNTTRLAHTKLRDDFNATQKKAAALEAESTRLRDILSVAQQSVAALEQTKAEHVAELTARRTHIAELQRHVQQQGTDLQLTREENRRLGERIVQADKRMVQLESETQAAQGKAMQAAQEQAAVEAAFDKARAELVQTARRLTETDRMLAATQARLKVADTGLAEAQADRSRLASALDEANHHHQDELNLSHTRFEALQARANLTEQLLEEARQALVARADEIHAFERQMEESSTIHDNAGERLARSEAALTERDVHISELEQAQATLADQNHMLANALAAHESAYHRAQQKVQEQDGLVRLFEEQLKAARDANEMQIEELHAQLQREQLERSMAEGALEAGRTDIARLLREISAVHRHTNPTADEIGEDRLRSAA